jgi:hypothetical protein
MAEQSLWRYTWGVRLKGETKGKERSTCQQMTRADPVGCHAQTRTLIPRPAGSLLTKVSTLREIRR